VRARLALLGCALAVPAWAGSRELELGVEEYYYRTAETPLNRDNLLGVERGESRLRGTLAWKESVGAARAVLRGFVERSFGAREATSWTARQAYLQYAWGAGLQLRVGKQRIAWGSGFAWNPTNRLERPKNPANTSLEQEGTLAARMDWIPARWAGVILLAARSQTGLGDLPFVSPAQERESAALRARFLAKDTDLALVFSGGKNQRTLLGFDLGRDLLGRVSAHAEGAFYRGSEIAPPRDGETFFRLATGLLHTQGTSSLAVEYFFNGEGYDGAHADAYLARVDATSSAAADPRLPPAARAAALRSYAALAAIPFSAGLGLRRHYLQVAWTRSRIGGQWTASLRGVVALSDGGVALTPGVVYEPRGDLMLSLDAIVLLGSARSEYRLTPLSGALQARAKVLF
jgi:hypothetical protein